MKRPSEPDTNNLADLSDEDLRWFVDEGYADAATELSRRNIGPATEYVRHIGKEVFTPFEVDVTSQARVLADAKVTIAHELRRKGMAPAQIDELLGTTEDSRLTTPAGSATV